MGRAPCCDKANVKKGPWSPEEDAKLKEFIDKYGTGGNWIALPQKVGLRRCGKSCRLRWLNYLRPNIKHGEFSDEEDRVIINLFANIGSRWSIIAAQLPGRTDNDIKNYWNTKLKKKLMSIIGNNNYKNNINQSSHLRRLSHNNIASSTNNNNNNNNISYDLLQPKSSSSYTSQHFESNIVSSYGSYMNMNMAPQERSTTSFMMLGQSYGDQASCSSSDSMVSNGVIVNLNSVNSTWVSSSSSPTNHQSNDGNNDNTNQVLDYGLEEIKQLISSTSSNANSGSNCGNNFLFDENKTEHDRLLYHYY